MLYKATNKSNNHSWVIAPDKKTAIKVLLKFNFIKKATCLLKTEKNGVNFYDFFKRKGDDINEVDNKIGIGCAEINQNKTVWRIIE